MRLYSYFQSEKCYIKDGNYLKAEAISLYNFKNGYKALWGVLERQRLLSELACDTEGSCSSLWQYKADSK